MRKGKDGEEFNVPLGRMAAVLAHSLIKEREVPVKGIEVTLERKRLFEQDPHRHTYREEYT